MAEANTEALAARGLDPDTAGDWGTNADTIEKLRSSRALLGEILPRTRILSNDICKIYLAFLAPCDRGPFLRWLGDQSLIITRALDLAVQYVTEGNERLLLYIDTPWIQSSADSTKAISLRSRLLNASASSSR
ncbi:hypothetical protein G7Z17_g7735 [Cylindrodendrum hubeiense]|uniref:Uncharacterized protein n=1 Tax=Cylindrodendrum hubeiense TaxID=595255 RepID=A0A9P5H8G7_9HYPO|nr:hypothetical protein G7Z17_g7735 [Cylindrodendrum hubeiense]